MTSSDKRTAFLELIKSFDVAMLATRDAEGRMQARPMAIADIPREDELVFVTSLNSGKIDEVEQDPHALVTFQSSARFASTWGRLRVDRERHEIERLWSESWRVWFPQGKSDPSICLLRFAMHDGEYWNMAGAHGIKHMFKAATAYLTGSKPTVDRTLY